MDIKNPLIITTWPFPTRYRYLSFKVCFCMFEIQYIVYSDKRRLLGLKKVTTGFLTIEL